MRQFLLALFLAPLMVFAQSDLVPGIIILKVKPEYKSALAREGALWDAFDGLSILKIEQLFPRAEEPMGRTDRHGNPFTDMTRTYKLAVDESEDLAVLIEKLSASNRFDWVEPTSYSISDATPNDPNIGSQNYLTQIGAFAAWDVTTGDTNVVIGVTDTSFDLLHQDLQGNLKRNYDDPVNGLDDDMDGLFDNYSGWDIESDDNQLFVSGNYHGTGVLAVSSATTNNSVGITGVGYNCKYLPVKIGSSAGTIVTADGYEAITYCADRDCQVINCSWGSTIFSNLGVDAVNYATINKDALVVASAGNMELEEYRYPASYNYAVSVTGVHNTDLFDNGTNPTFTWADSVDLCAQGFNVYSTATVGGTQGASPVYTTSGGTSFAAPQVSGAAALVRSQFPCLSAIETAELLIDKAVDIESIGTNGDFAGKIGKRLDVGAALNIAINPCELVSIATPQEEMAMTVYPNPSAGNATLVVSIKDDWNMQVFSTRGEQVIQAQFTDNTHQIHGLADGLYLITLSNGKQLHTQRLVVTGNR